MEQERNSTVTGIAMTLAVHVAVLVLVSFTGISYIYPPPPETTFVLDFEEETELPEPIRRRGSEPQGELVDREKEINLVQRSESPYTQLKNNATPETRADDFGDIDTPTPPQEEVKLDARASFPGMSKKDTSVTAPHSASEESAQFKAGQAQGNTDEGVTEGKPNAHLEGRSLKGSTLYKPSYKIQRSGQVVVRISVDQYGNVKSAQAGAEGTTISDNRLWNECRNQALKAKFSMNVDAPTLQTGTITYIFNLK